MSARTRQRQGRSLSGEVIDLLLRRLEEMVVRRPMTDEETQDAILILLYAAEKSHPARRTA